MASWLGSRVTLMGLGRHGGGLGAARWLARQGALVTITDLADAVALTESVQALSDVPLHAWHLGSHAADDFRQADAVVVNPAVRPGNPLVAMARESGAQITSEIELFLQACPAKVIGVTGSSGKSTTACLIAAILRAAGQRTWLGGNLGGSLLNDLDLIGPQDWVVLEMSSFQLHYLSDDCPLPAIAVVTNCTPNHLDWHDDWEHYCQAKQQLLAQQPGRQVVLNTYDAEAASWRRLVGNQQVPLPALQNLPPLNLPGEHNRINAACAAAAALSANCSMEDVVSGLAAFQGLVYRLQFVAEVQGRRFYNDTKATTPEATLAALAAFDAPIWLLAGGSDKGCDYSQLATTISRRAAGVALFGAVRETLAKLVGQKMHSCKVLATEQMADALQWCWQASRPGDVILLSPACASFDQYRDYAERGEVFNNLVAKLSVD